MNHKKQDKMQKPKLIQEVVADFQYSIYYTEVTHVHQALKKAFSNAFLGFQPDLTLQKQNTDERDREVTDNSNAVVLQRRHHANIDLPRGASIDLDNDLIVSSINWNELVPARDEDLHMDVDGVSLINSIELGEVTPNSPQLGRHPLGSHQASDLEAITLNEPHIYDYNSLGQQGEPMGNFYDRNQPGFDQGLFEFGHDEAGLLEGHAPELDDVIRRAASSNQGQSRTGQHSGRASSAFGQAGFGGPVSSSVVGFDNPFGNDLGGEMLPVYDIDEPFIVPDRQSVPFGGPQLAYQRDKTVAIDQDTALTDDQVREMRRAYANRVQNERQLQESVRSSRTQIAEADAFILNPPVQWDKKRAPSSARHEGPDKVKRARADEGGALPFEPLPDYDPNLNLGYGGGDDFYGMHGFDEPELGRAAGSATQRTADSRAAAREQFPWHAEVVSSDVGGDLMGFSFGGVASSQVGPGRVSLDMPLRSQAQRRSRTVSLVPSTLHEGSARDGSVGLLGDDVERLQGFEEQEPLQLASPERQDEGIVGTSTLLAQEVAQLELESLKFLSFITRQAPVQPDQDLNFSDIVPVAKSTAQIASAAFYHTLNLTSKRHLKVYQREPYGEIRIKVLAQASTAA
ncbi:R8 protein [Microbotryomycetes sp. JL201]|nr:R8 protein [Microbotryomycetes sp. JL201]